MKTYMANNQTIERKWFVVDAAGKRVGRLATEVATVLRGKNKVTFTPHVDCGDYVIVINADKVELTGNKWADKKYYRHSQYPGGLRETTAKRMNETFPERIVEFAVKGMLPKNKLGAELFRNLYVVEGAEHDHGGQQPKELNINDLS
jgi:large subunit ribosomal protein L13